MILVVGVAWHAVLSGDGNCLAVTGIFGVKFTVKIYLVQCTHWSSSRCCQYWTYSSIAVRGSPQHHLLWVHIVFPKQFYTLYGVKCDQCRWRLSVCMRGWCLGYNATGWLRHQSDAPCTGLTTLYRPCEDNHVTVKCPPSTRHLVPKHFPNPTTPP